MTTGLAMDAPEFTNRDFPERVSGIDLDASCRQFARTLEADLRKLYPDAEIVVRIVESGRAGVFPDREDVGLSGRPEARNLYVAVRYAVDRLFFCGEFWTDRSSARG